MPLFPESTHTSHKTRGKKYLCRSEEVKKSFRDIQLSGGNGRSVLVFFQAFRGFPFDDFGEEMGGYENVMERNEEIFFSSSHGYSRYAQ